MSTLAFTAKLLAGSVLTGFACATLPVGALAQQKASPPDFSSGNAGWLTFNVDFSIVPGGTSPMRNDPAHPTPIPSGKILAYRIRLPNVSHTFRTGHRIMVQVQSTWFPLYDRNPQSWVDNIMYAKSESYVKAAQRVWRTAEHSSRIELPVIP